MKLSKREPIGVARSNYAEEPQYENDHDYASQGNRQVHTGLQRPCWCYWGCSSGTRSKASGRAAVRAGSIRTRFLCRSRLLQTILRPHATATSTLLHCGMRSTKSGEES